jgi:hypothetical protein
MVTEECIEYEQSLEFAGYNNTGYQGGFPSRVLKRIEQTVQSPCLHLFSGSSLIGDERIDIKHPNATKNMNVYQFLQEDNHNWKYVVLDPDYCISRKDIKLKVHGLKESVGGNKLAEKLLAQYFQKHAENILWFDMTSPCFDGFYRAKIWLYVMGGFRPARILTLLKREGTNLECTSLSESRKPET